MKAVATKNSPKESRRPNLVIDTDVHTKKKTWQHLFQKDRTSPKLRISKSSTTQSLPTPPPTNPMKEMERAQTSDDYSSISGVQSVFKKLQMSQRNKKRYSSDMIQISDVPEPVMPSLVNWSPEAPISPPPWEYDNKPPLLKRHSSGLRSQVNSIKNMFQPESDASGYHSDNEITKLNRHESTHSIGHSSDVTLVESRHSNNSSPELTRRSSCPNIADDDSVSSSSTLASVITPTSSSSSWNDKDIIAITEQHTRRMTGLKKYVHPVEKQPTFKPCQKAKARAAEVAASGNTLPPGSSPSICSIYDDNLKYLYIPNVFDPITNEPVLEFTSIRPRRFKLHRKTSWKKEAKALMVWQQGLKNSLSNSQPSNALVTEINEKQRLTRRFILREFFVTEVSFWNQLYYTKIMFYEAYERALQYGSPFVKDTSMDVFANLFELMQFSAKLINRLRHFQLYSAVKLKEVKEGPCANIECNNSYIGKAIVAMAEDFVIFLRCAMDYNSNRKILTSSNKGYEMYKQKLFLKKETSQFTMEDYLIIPIQRVARYGLLLTDLLKHTEKTHVDYDNLVKAHKIVSSLAVAMDSVQKKQK